MKTRTSIPALLFALAIFSSCCDNSGANKTPAIAKDASIEAKIRKTISGMTLEEKAGQLVQITLGVVCDENNVIDPEKLEYVIGEKKVGSILNVVNGAETPEAFARKVRTIQEVSLREIGIPCVYGLDMIHGATYFTGATFFPQEINLGATFNPHWAKCMGEAIGYETRSGMVPWVFSPVMDLTREPAWPRNYESFGEDPYLQSVMASAEVKAIQGPDPNCIDRRHCAVSIKHYMGYGAPKSGQDRTPAIICESDLRDKFFAPFKACIESGALTVMVNSASINGIPTHANRRLLTGWLKEGLNWDGMVVTDWADIRNLYERDHMASSEKEAVAMGINAGIDMIMDPVRVETCDLICENVREGAIPMKRIDDAVSRVLRLKYRLGLFEKPVWDTSSYTEFAGEEFTQAALQAAVESEVLLKNDGVLPISKGSRILLTGPNANSVRTLNGGWSYFWQGSDDPKFVGEYNTILTALRNTFGEKNVKYVPGVSYKGEDWTYDEPDRFDQAVNAARSSDVVIACIGENTYCETPGNIDDLNLSTNQYRLVEELCKTGKPVVLVLNEGRTRLLGELPEKAAAIIDIILPGNYGADALAMLVSGEENFSGRLPFTYQSCANSLHTYDYKTSESRSTMAGMYNYDAKIEVEWPFGYGLSYTGFQYSNLVVENPEFKAGDTISVSVDITNTGKVSGKEAVLLYVSDIVASRIMPDIKRLRAFDKVFIEPGQTETVKFEIPASDLAYVDNDGRWILEKGEFRLAVERLSAAIACTETKIWKNQNK